MWGSHQAGPSGVWVPRVPPLIGEAFKITVTRVERPGMFSEPRIGVAEPSLSDGIWIEFRSTRLLTQTFFLDLALIPNEALIP